MTALLVSGVNASTAACWVNVAELDTLLLTKSAMVENVSEGTMPGERTVLSTLEGVAEDMEREAVRPPAIVVIGQVVAVANPDRYPALSH